MREKVIMIDFHSHFLPGMDDGSSSVSESINMLKALEKQNIDIAVATPHFYLDLDSVSSFLKRREESHAKLSEVIKTENSSSESEKSLPEIVLGAEVEFFNDLHALDKLESLCIANSNYILIEMPFDKWTKRTYDGVHALIARRGLIPIIAHLDRYIDIQKDFKRIEQLVELNVIVQINSSFVNGLFTRRKAFSLFENGFAHLLGSDCHNMTTRPPTIGEAYDKIESRLGSDFVKKIDQTGRKILGDLQGKSK